MAVELRVPAVGESITEVQIGEWLKPEGASVELNEAVVVIETDKATVEVSAPVAGVISRVLKAAGAAATVGEVIGYVEEAGKAAATPAPQPAVSAAPAPQPAVPAAPAPQPAVSAAPAPQPAVPLSPQPADLVPETRVMPAAQRALDENGVRAEDVEATGPGGRLLKEDVLRHVEAGAAAASRAAASPAKMLAAVELAPPSPAARLAPSAPAVISKAQAPAAAAAASDLGGARGVETVPMTPMRKKIAERLVQAQQTAALLTTFNEVDMGEVIALRQEHQESFQKQHGVKLGFMSFFVKAAVDALRRLPQLNAEIRADSIVYHNYQDIGVAVGGGKGLVVPILRNAELMSFSEIERAIADYGKRAQENKLKLEELQGGTFTISNGGIYGSLLSTPIVNPPQSGILGLHAIQKRAVVVEDQVVVRSMMYVALTYDHRIVDGREAVTFLKRVKECVETPSRMLLEV